MNLMTFTLYNYCFGLVSFFKISYFLVLLVVTASLASEALSIVKEKWNELNLALVEVYLPDMGIILLS